MTSAPQHAVVLLSCNPARLCGSANVLIILPATDPLCCTPCSTWVALPCSWTLTTPTATQRPVRQSPTLTWTRYWWCPALSPSTRPASALCAKTPNWCCPQPTHALPSMRPPVVACTCGIGEQGLWGVGFAWPAVYRAQVLWKCSIVVYLKRRGDCRFRPGTHQDLDQAPQAAGFTGVDCFRGPSSPRISAVTARLSRPYIGVWP